MLPHLAAGNARNDVRRRHREENWWYMCNTEGVNAEQKPLTNVTILMIFPDTSIYQFYSDITWRDIRRVMRAALRDVIVPAGRDGERW